MTAATTPTCPTAGTFTVQPYTATKEDYQAVSAIFGAILTAACIIWGVKRLFLLFYNGPES